MRRLVPALACIALGAAAPAAAQNDRDARLGGMAEDALRTAALERGAFAACPATGPDAAEAPAMLRRGWELDIAETRKLLLETGLSEGYVGALLARYGLDQVTPGITDATARRGYCAAVGDWLTRYLQFRYMTPQAEIRRRLTQR